MIVLCATCGTPQVEKVDDESVTSENWTADSRVRTGYVWRCLPYNHWFTVYDPLPELEEHGELIPSEEHGHRALIGREYIFVHSHQSGTKRHIHSSGEEGAFIAGVTEWIAVDDALAMVTKEAEARAQALLEAQHRA